MEICVSLSRVLPIPFENPDCVVVIDVVRSATSCATALANGACRIRMFGSIEKTLAAASRLEQGSYLLCGERGSTKIPGFHLGNSPREYCAEIVGGREILISTTNGPAAFEQFKSAKTILLASWVNLSATVKRIEQVSPPRLAIICAGTFGFVSMEDVICAGGILKGLGDLANPVEDGCIVANSAFEKYGSDEVFLANLPQMEGGRRLAAKGMQEDFISCTTRDSITFAMEYDRGEEAFLVCHV